MRGMRGCFLEGSYHNSAPQACEHHSGIPLCHPAHPSMGPAADTPIWNVRCVAAHTSVLDYNNLGKTWRDAPDDPMATWYRRVMARCC